MGKMPHTRLLSSSDSADSSQGVTFDPDRFSQISSVSSLSRTSRNLDQKSLTQIYLNQGPSYPASLSGRQLNGRNRSSETSSEAEDPQSEMADSDFSDFQQSTESGSDSFQEESFLSKNCSNRFLKSQKKVTGSSTKKNDTKSFQRQFEDLLRKHKKSHLMKIHQTFIRLWRTGALCDIILKTYDTQIPVHSAVVVGHSGLCEKESRDFHSNNTLPIIINLPEKLKTKAVLLVVDFIYLATLEIDLMNIVSIHEVAKEMEVYLVTARCSKILDRLLEDQNIVQTIQAATELGIEDLQEICWSKFTKDFKAFCSRSSFQEQNLQTVLKVFSADHLLVKSEFEVFEAAMVWINYRRDERMRHLARLMDCVRLIYMTSEELINCMQYDPAFATSPGLEILAQANMKKMLKDRGELSPDCCFPRNRIAIGQNHRNGKINDTNGDLKERIAENLFQTQIVPAVSCQSDKRDEKRRQVNLRQNSAQIGSFSALGPAQESPFATNRASPNDRQQRGRDLHNTGNSVPSPNFLLPDF